MANTVEFEGVGVRELKATVEEDPNGVYVGGSNKTDFEEFVSYIRGQGRKKLGREPVTCLWARTQNARSAENKLLTACADACDRNEQRRSNLQATAGFVYVLR